MVKYLTNMILENTYFHMPAFDTEDSSITYPFMEFAEEQNIRLNDPLNNDCDWYYRTNNFCSFKNGEIVFIPELIEFLKNKTGLNPDDIKKS